MTNEREWEIEEQRAQIEREIAENLTREAAYQSYLDRMTDLLKEGLLELGPDDVNRSVARARTLTVLRRLDGERKGLLLRFLYDAGLIGECGKEGREKAIVDLHGANLSGVNLEGAKLPRASLSRANLEGAMVTEEQLAQAWTLEGATLPDGTAHK